MPHWAAFLLSATGGALVRRFARVIVDAEWRFTKHPALSLLQRWESPEQATVLVRGAGLAIVIVGIVGTMVALVSRV